MKRSSYPPGVNALATSAFGAPKIGMLGLDITAAGGAGRRSGLPDGGTVFAFAEKSFADTR